MSKIKVAFAGTPEFAVPCLQALLQMPDVEVTVVYTQPDKPVGRGRKMSPTAVKKAALEAGIEVRQPVKLNNKSQLSSFDELKVDVMVVVAYGLLLTQSWLNTPVYGCINVHASLLPRWRGAAPIQRAIEAGDTTTGVCLMQMDRKLDAGPVYSCVETAIEAQDTATSLHHKLSLLGANLLQQKLMQIISGQIRPVPQQESLVCYANKLDKTESVIHWNIPARQIVNKVHAFNPWPVATTCYEDLWLRVLRAHVVENTQSSEPPGRIVRADNQLYVQAKDAVVAIDEIQKPGSKAMPVQAFLAGNALRVGAMLRI